MQNCLLPDLLYQLSTENIDESASKAIYRSKIAYMETDKGHMSREHARGVENCCEIWASVFGKNRHNFAGLF